MYVLCVCLLLTQWTVVVAVVCAQSKSTFRGEISIQNVTSKLALLTMHFPKVSLYFVCPHPPPPNVHAHVCGVCAMRSSCHKSLLCQQLKLLWTQNPHATAALFEELKVSISCNPCSHVCVVLYKLYVYKHGLSVQECSECVVRSSIHCC